MRESSYLGSLTFCCYAIFPTDIYRFDRIPEGAKLDSLRHSTSNQVVQEKVLERGIRTHRCARDPARATK